LLYVCLVRVYVL